MLFPLGPTMVCSSPGGLVPQSCVSHFFSPKVKQGRISCRGVPEGFSLKARAGAHGAWYAVPLD